MNEILKIIRERKSSRVLFDPDRKISKQDLEQILEAGRWAPTAHNMQNFEIIVIDDQKILEAIGKINYPVSETFVRENFRQLSFSEYELKKKKTGILGTMFPPSWRKPDFKIEEAAGETMNMSLGNTIQSTPVFLILLYDPERRAPASEGDFLGIISLGCAMENMWLMAESLGISLHIVSSISAGPVEKDVKKILNIPENLKIAFSIRLGYPMPEPPKPLRVRRDLDDFTHHNRYGKKGFES